MNKVVSVVLLMGMLVLFSSCGNVENSQISSRSSVDVSMISAEEISIASIVLSNNALEIVVGEDAQLTAIVSPDGYTEKMNWKSANEEVAVVDENGVVSGISVGNTNIVLTSEGGVTAICEVSVGDMAAFDKLDDEEKEFVDKFVVVALKHFKDPASVEIRGIMECTGNSATGGDFWAIEIASNNSFGGTSVEYYALTKEGVTFAEVEDVIIFNDPQYDCEVITQAIHEQ